MAVEALSGNVGGHSRSGTQLRMIAERVRKNRSLQKMLEAKDGRKQTHMDVLVAVFWRLLFFLTRGLAPNKRPAPC